MKLLGHRCGHLKQASENDGLSYLPASSHASARSFSLNFEMLNLRLNKVTGNARYDLQEPAIGDGSYTFNLSMMIGDELEVRYKRAEAFPPGKRLGMDHDADKCSVRCDEWVDLLCEVLEILFFEGSKGSDEQNTPVPQQFKFDHGNIHSMSSGWVAG